MAAGLFVTLDWAGVVSMVAAPAWSRLPTSTPVCDHDVAAVLPPNASPLPGGSLRKPAQTCLISAAQQPAQRIQLLTEPEPPALLKLAHPRLGKLGASRLL